MRLRFATQLFNGFVQCQTFDRGVIDLDDQVAGFQACAGSGCVFDRCNDFNKAIFHAHFNAQATEFTMCANLELFEGFCIQVRGMRVQIGDHAGDGIVDELLILNRFYVALFDGIKDFGKGA